MQAIFVLFITFFISTLSLQRPDAIIGEWYSSSGGAKIRIYKQSEKYFGKIIWLRKPNDDRGRPKTDIHNRDPDLRSRPAIGLEILRDFKYTGDNAWGDGKVYDPKSGNTYSSKMTLDDNGNLDIRGFIGFSLIGRTVTWKRANDH